MRVRCVRRSRVVLSPRRWGQANEDDSFATEANKPGLWGERGVSRKAIAQGVPVVSAHLYRLVGTFLSAHKACGCGQRPVLPAPSDFGGTPNCKTRTEFLPRERCFMSSPLSSSAK